MAGTSGNENCSITLALPQNHTSPSGAILHRVCSPPFPPRALNSEPSTARLQMGTHAISDDAEPTAHVNGSLRDQGRRSQAEASYDFKFPNPLKTKLVKGGKRKRPLVTVFSAPSEVKSWCSKEQRASNCFITFIPSECSIFPKGHSVLGGKD